ALELFKPFVIRQLVERGLAPNVKSAKRVIERGKEEIWGILEEIVRDHPVLLNRAPTLHRLGIQAFEPVLMEGKAIRLHPMVCTAFNADFDGDQMAVHVPLSIEAQAESRLLMLSANNLLSPASGKPVVTPTQDIILGIYYLTNMRDGMNGEGMHFSSIDDVLSAFSHGTVHVNAKIWLRIGENWNSTPSGCRKYRGKKNFIIAEENEIVKTKPGSMVFIQTTPGRALFNSVLPEELLYVNDQMDKKNVGKLLDKAYDRVDRSSIVNTLDAIKKLGYHWAARSGISFGVGSIIIPEDKYSITSEARDQDVKLKSEYEMGLLTEDEYLFQKEVLWGDAAKAVADSIVKNMELGNPLHMMVDSGARGSRGQMGQMAGIRGLVSDPSGRIIDYPITSNFREGMDMLEYFISTHGARKGLADTALRTAKSGYLTRRLVDVSQDLIITEEDCHTEKGVLVRPLKSDGKVMISLAERIVGRNSLEDIKDGSGKLVIAKNELILNDHKAKMIEKALEENGKEELWIRSPLSCELRNGVCQKCYGMDLSARREVPIGEAVGVVAAQSIGEPGTQLTMRTFHTGGVRLSGEDITQGLPRIEQLFEVRRPKKIAYLAGVDGVISEIRISDGKRKIFIIPDGVDDPETETTIINIPAIQELNDEIREGVHVQKDTRLTEGSDDPQQLLEVKGIEAVQQWLVDQIQDVYRSQGVSINNKHIEVILRKVAPVNRVRVVEEGDTSLVVGDLVWLQDIEKEMEEIKQENETSIKEAIEVFSGKKFKGTLRQNDELSKYAGKPLDSDIIRELAKPEYQVTHFIIEDKGEDIIVVVGEAAFRKQMEGLELIKKFNSKSGVEIKEGEKLTASQLKLITSCKPQTVFVRDHAMLEAFVNSAWLAEDIKDDNGKLIAQADCAITLKTLEKIRNKDIRSIRKWSNVERVDVLDVLKTDLMNGEFWAKPLSKIIDSNGDEVSNIPQLVDGSVTRGLIDGATMAIEIEVDDQKKIITRQNLLFRVISHKVAGKILLEPIVDNKGNVVIDAGKDINEAVIEAISELAPSELVVRSIGAKSEEKRFVNCFSFVRKLRKNPECRPFIHGVTKAALATESFLSAASFQQTAQILAGAAVKGQIDPLLGLKESVIIGHLIPAGTGAAKFRKEQPAPSKTT
ncbi:MAG: DNA-directed RNA polymerase subunit beta', partial [Synergistaceae bacterium]|nr:DNA-directed RNA polymerase subunit beta' [Synergistaceae bacterium]